MKDVFLSLSSLGTDRTSESVHYEVQAGDARIIGDTVRVKSDDSSRVRIAVVPDGTQVALLTPDVRIELIVSAQAV